MKDIGNLLKKHGLLRGADFQCLPLEGGVSSEIFLVINGDRQFVVKKALPQLKVKDEWKADTSRNRVEQDFIKYISHSQPSLTPEIIYSDLVEGFFVMEYLGPDFKNWKEQLMEGIFEPETTEKAAVVLARLHTESANDPEAQKIFDTTDNFHNLRISPYLHTTASRNPKLKSLFLQEADRLGKHRQCLVHGDFSPKNILVGQGRIVLLDHEVAWYGDPAFDLGFMLTHLYLKQLVNRRALDHLPDLVQVFWQAYFKQYKRNINGLDSRAVRLWLMILLARIDGKSPVPYFQNKPLVQQFIRSFVNDVLPTGNFDHGQLHKYWKEQLNNFIKNGNS